MPSEYDAYLLLLYLLINVAVFCVYGWDKRAARLGKRRIRERTLLLIAFAGGAGAFAAQRLLRHKTRKPPFRLVLPFLFILQAMLLVSVATTPGTALLQRIFTGL
jgi:uncharacterized membrane protein YsdA (DUF1294 family)